MFRRLVFENSAALFTIVAFLTAASIYVWFTWRALRMKRPQIARFAHLPFEIETPVALRVSPGIAVDSSAQRPTAHAAGYTSRHEA